MTAADADRRELYSILDGVGTGRLSKFRPEVYLVGADWCEERGDDATARGLRRMAEMRKRPTGSYDGGRRNVAWWGWVCPPWGTTVSFHLDGEHFDRLAGGAPGAPGTAWYSSPALAILALAAVLGAEG